MCLTIDDHCHDQVRVLAFSSNKAMRESPTQAHFTWSPEMRTMAAVVP